MANAEEACVLDSVGVLKLEASRARERTAGDARGFDPHPPKHTTQTTQVEVEFHGAPYLISVATPNDETLVVEVEDAESLARWRGEFSAKCGCLRCGGVERRQRRRRRRAKAHNTHTPEASDTPTPIIKTNKDVEDLTARTGSFKRFPVFARMLVTAALRTSDAVYMDLLTYADLELLKAKRAAAAAAAAAGSGGGGGMAAALICCVLGVSVPSPAGRGGMVGSAGTAAGDSDDARPAGAATSRNRNTRRESMSVT